MTARIVGLAFGRYVVTEAEPSSRAAAVPEPEPPGLPAEPEPEADL